ncbi:MAG: hypothetical protein ACR2LE_05925 [Nocardioidaceae bacterium]
MRTSRSLRTTSFLSVLGSLTAAATLLTAGSATARPLALEHFSDSGSDVLTGFCGDLHVRASFEVNGSYHLNQHGPDGAAYELVNVRFMDSITNLDNDQTMTHGGALHNQFVRIEVKGDGTYTVHARGTGVIQTRGPNGRLFTLNAAALSYDLLFSDSGTPGDFTDDELIEGPTVVKSVGRDDTAGRDFCTDVHTLIG